MLWTDRDWITPADLYALDREIYDIASAEELVLRDREGSIHQGIAEASVELNTILQVYNGEFALGGVSGGHLAAVRNVGVTGFYQTPRLHLSQIVVSSDRPDMPSALRRWAQYSVLAYIYRQASLTKLDDRHQQKLDVALDMISRRWKPYLYAEGVPAIVSPLAAPGALWERGTGTWDHSCITTAAGGAASEMEVDIAISFTGEDYVDQDDQGNAESAISEPVRVVIPASEQVTIDITTLTPLDTQPKQTAYTLQYTPLTTTGWNVWIGAANRDLYLQQASPIAIATKTYGPVTPTLSGTAMQHEGQYPDAKYIVQRVTQRA